MRASLNFCVCRYAVLPGEDGELLHRVVDAGTDAGDYLFVGGCVEDGFYHFGDFHHEVFLGAARRDGGSAEAYAACLEC